MSMRGILSLSRSHIHAKICRRDYIVLCGCRWRKIIDTHDNAMGYCRYHACWRQPRIQRADFLRSIYHLAAMVLIFPVWYDMFAQCVRCHVSHLPVISLNAIFTTIAKSAAFIWARENNWLHNNSPNWIDLLENIVFILLVPFKCI